MRKGAGGWRVAAALGLASLLSACRLGAEAERPTAWSGVLAPRGTGSLLQGTVGAVSEGFNTRATITVSQAQPSETLAWRIREGTCNSAGSDVGVPASYPNLAANASGDAATSTVIPQRLRSGVTYHAVVISTGGGAQVLACGALARTTFALGEVSDLRTYR